MSDSVSPVLLIVDDEQGVIQFLEQLAAKLGFEVVSRAGGREAIDALADVQADVAFVDLRMPQVDGIAVLKAIRQQLPSCQVVLMTGHATVDSAIEAVKLGALDYLSKPFELDRVRELLAAARDELVRRRELLASDRDTAHRLEFAGMIGRSAVMQELFDLVRRIAPHARSALVTGETGTGKELVARALHDRGPRKRRRFVTVNCSAVVESLFESELFGHVRGAFTGATDHKTGLFEAADGGTLFLDEVGELPLAVQAKLLRVLELGEVHRVGSLQPKQVDVRIVAATNRDLTVEAAEGRFRSDLLYRLNVLQLELPPLRERLEDIPYLVAAFVETFAARFQKQIGGVTPAAERLLARQRWLGNVRELRNVVERACILAEGSLLHELDIQTALPAGETVPVVAPVAPAAGPPRGMNALQEVEWQHIERALRETGGNKAAAARRLGVSRRLLYRRLERYGAPGA